MITDRILPGLVLITAAIFVSLPLVAQQFGIAACALALGLLWFILVTQKTWSSSTVLFLLFLGVAVWGCFNSLPVIVILLGVSTDLAAWDLSRFRARIALATPDDAIRALETHHLRKLGVTLTAGFAIALLPVFVNLSLGFIGFALAALLAMLAFRQAIASAQQP